MTCQFFYSCGKIRLIYCVEGEPLMNLGRDIFAGVTMALASMAALTATASMLQMAGMDFAAAYTASTLLAIVGTFLAAIRGYGIVVTPSLTVTAYLVFIAAISHGLGWQVMLGLSFTASLLGLLLWQFCPQRLRPALPAALLWGSRLALAVFLICLGLKMGRIIITSPWQVTMLGEAADPLLYWSMAGIVLVLVLIAGKWRSALFMGMMVTAAATFVEGFWVIPTAPCLVPEGLDKVVGQLSWSVGSAGELAFFWTTAAGLLLMLGVMHSTIWEAFGKVDHEREGVRFLFALGAVGALCGVPPLVISPATVASYEAADHRRAAFVAAAVLALALFFEPVVAAMADFPAMVVPVLTGGGFLLLLSALTNGKLAAAEPERRAEMLAVITLVLLLPLSGNFVTALGASLLGYALFMSMAGNARQVTGATWLLSGLFGLYFLYGSIF